MKDKIGFLLCFAMLAFLASSASGEVLIVSSAPSNPSCHCGPNCLCSPCTGNCSTVERLEAEFLKKHPNQKAWIKTGAHEAVRLQYTSGGEQVRGPDGVWRWSVAASDAEPKPVKTTKAVLKKSPLNLNSAPVCTGPNCGTQRRGLFGRRR